MAGILLIALIIVGFCTMPLLTSILCILTVFTGTDELVPSIGFIGLIVTGLLFLI